MMSFIALWGTFNLIMSLYSIKKIKGNPDKCDFIYGWGLPSGAFVWEDMFIYGLLHALIVLVSVLFGKTVIWIIGFLVFWIVRSLGETLYFFLEQFIVPKHHPHELNSHFKYIRLFFGNISEQKCFILLQICMQSITVIATSLLIFVLYSI